MRLDWAAAIGLLLALVGYAMFLSDKGKRTDEDDDVETVLDITVITDDFEEELEDDEYFEDEEG